MMVTCVPCQFFVVIHVRLLHLFTNTLQKSGTENELTNTNLHSNYLPPQSMDHFDDIGPSVVMASPGMMQSGLSRELFESWCTDKRNGVIIAGYCVEGTLAKV